MWPCTPSETLEHQSQENPRLVPHIRRWWVMWVRFLVLRNHNTKLASSLISELILWPFGYAGSHYTTQHTHTHTHTLHTAKQRGKVSSYCQTVMLTQWNTGVLIYALQPGAKSCAGKSTWGSLHLKTGNIDWSNVSKLLVQGNNNSTKVAQLGT